MREATWRRDAQGKTPEFQSTPPVREATVALAAFLDAAPVSIHAPREGGDENLKTEVVGLRVSIHAPREGGDSPLFNCPL